MPESDLVQLSAVDAVAAMRDRKLRPREYLEALLARIEATEPTVRAWEFIDADAALAQCDALERSDISPSSYPLFGLPVGFKDVIDVKGQPTRAGFEPYRDRIAREDSGVAQGLRAGGAILLGKTVAAQFAWSQDPPKTRNPWNLEHTPGASTTGSPVAVAARHVPVALGTQTTSSLLRPASYCGVVGLKPTYGRLSCYGIFPTAWSSDHPGTVTRSVADAALVLGPLARHDARDPHSAQQSLEDFMSGLRTPLTAPRLGRVVDLFDRASEPVREAATRSVAQLESHGAQIVDIRLPIPMDLVLAIHWTVHNAESAAIHFEQYGAHRTDYLPTVRTNVEISELLPAGVAVHALRWKRRARPQMEGLLNGLDALIAPTSSDQAPRVDTNQPSHKMGDPSFQIPWTCFGMPNITLPTGLDASHLPNGLQLIAGRFADAALLRVAAWCEAVFGTLPSPL